MRRVLTPLISSIAALMIVACGASSGIGQSHPYPGTAKLVGSVRNCGGPTVPNHPVYCQAQRSVQVRATLTSGQYAGEEASGTSDAKGSFLFLLRPGHWTVAVRMGAAIRTQHVVLKAHKTGQARFVFSTIK